LNGARFINSHALSTGRLGATGFHFWGGVVNALAVEMGDARTVAVPYYGRAAMTADVPKLTAALMIQNAEDDPRINEAVPAYAEAFKAYGKTFEMHT
tara:strand:+ start:21056 stop:21346 length:291 start_codon:yes stop_codon:yes gene_type:complete